MNSVKYLIRAHQMKDRIDTPNKKKNKAIIDNLYLRKHFVEIDRIRYASDSISLIYAEKDYIDQYRDLKLFLKEDVGKKF